MGNEFAYALTDIQRFIHFVVILFEREFRSITDSVLGNELLIHYTASKPMSKKYVEFWKTVEKDTSLQYYSYNECLLMIQNHFNSKLFKFFKKIGPGWRKVLMFKLITMYIKTGIVIDPNVMPNVSPDVLKKNGISSYIAISEKHSYVNMMLMANTSSRRSVLFLTLLLSYLISDQEMFDLYSTLAYNIGTIRLESDETYQLNEVKYQVFVGKCNCGEKKIDLMWFPDDEIYEVNGRTVSDSEHFSFYIRDSHLYIVSKDGKPWDHNVTVDIVFFANEVLYTLSEDVNDETYEVKKCLLTTMTYRRNRLYIWYSDCN
jgi:hypothetical protein